MAQKRARWSENDHVERTKTLRSNINSLNRKISKHAEQIVQKDFEAQQLNIQLQMYKTYGSPAGAEKDQGSTRSTPNITENYDSPNPYDIKVHITQFDELNNMNEDS